MLPLVAPDADYLDVSVPERPVAGAAPVVTGPVVAVTAVPGPEATTVSPEPTVEAATDAVAVAAGPEVVLDADGTGP